MGSGSSKAWDPSTEIPDLSGKVMIVTGANSGIGYTTTEQLARHGARVYVAARNEARAHAAIEKIHANNKGVEVGKLVFLPLDLADLDSVVEAAEWFMKQESRLDILINNAAVVTWDYQTTKQGFELCVGTSHIGHFLFTMRLLPLLKATAMEKDSDVRVVSFSSAGHRFFMAPLTFNLPSDFTYPGISPSPPTHTGFLNQSSRNAVAQTAIILFTSELQRRMDAENIPMICTCLSPGGVATEGQAGVRMGWFTPLWWVIKRVMSKGAEEGALPGLWLAVGREVRDGKEGFKGGYFEEDRRMVEPSRLAGDEVVAGNLWELSEKMVGKWLV